jgi:hypothetical protein
MAGVLIGRHGQRTGHIPQLARDHQGIAASGAIARDRLASIDLTKKRHTNVQWPTGHVPPGEHDRRVSGQEPIQKRIQPLELDPRRVVGQCQRQQGPARVGPHRGQITEVDGHGQMPDLRCTPRLGEMTIEHDRVGGTDQLLVGIGRQHAPVIADADSHCVVAWDALPDALDEIKLRAHGCWISTALN